LLQEPPIILTQSTNEGGEIGGVELSVNKQIFREPTLGNLT
jgi:hypothetical protein